MVTGENRVNDILRMNGGTGNAHSIDETLAAGARLHEFAQSVGAPEMSLVVEVVHGC